MPVSRLRLEYLTANSGSLTPQQVVRERPVRVCMACERSVIGILLDCWPHAQGSPMMTLLRQVIVVYFCGVGMGTLLNILTF